LNLNSNIQLEHEIAGLIDYFQKSRIPAMPVKGPILAKYLYGDIGLRQVSRDLDILVKYETLEKARDALCALGYKFHLLEQKRDFLCPSASSRKNIQAVFFKKMHGVEIALDLHCRIRGFFSDEGIERLWQEAKYFEIGSEKILMPSNEDYIVYLCLISITTAEFVQPKYIYDIHRLVTVYGRQLDWGLLLERAVECNLKNCLYFPLKLSNELFSTEMPFRFLEKLRPAWPTRKSIGLWINVRSVLAVRQKAGCGYPLRYMLGRYLYSGNTADFLNKSFRRILH
jgi:hypothetical protein